MRKFLVCVILAGFSLPLFAANRLTVEQLEQALAGAKTKADSDLARELAGMELSERLSSARLEQLRVNLPGERSQHALIALADTSAFLEPSAADIPATATPDAAAQRRMMAQTVNYLGKTLPLLPNLFAARDTMRFETRPDVAERSAENPLREAGKNRVTVLYRNGREFVDAGTDKNKKAQAPDKGLTTWGEFGPILGTVLIDAAHSRLAWSHWELAGSGPEAVFKYTVPKEKSHYDVRFCCVAESYGFEVSQLTQRVGYHGEITVDPDTGTILRLTVLADVPAGDPIGKADIAVEYGPTQIGGRTYFCPTRGIALAQSPDLKTLGKAFAGAPAAGNGAGNLPNFEKASLSAISQSPRQTLLNDVAFREFHLFRSESKLIVGKEGAAGTESAASALASSPTAATDNVPAAERPAEDTAVESSTLTPQPATLAAVAEPAAGPAPEPVIPEITVANEAGLPNIPDVAQAGSESAVTLRVNARLVDVPLVALDKKGRPITNLKPEELEVFDNGAKASLHSFSPAEGAPAQATPSAASQDSPAAADSHSFSNHAMNAASPMKRGQQGNTIILLIDSNLSFDDLSNVREQMRTFLKGLDDSVPVALYVMRVGGFQILKDATSDHALLADTLMKWTPSAENLSLGQEQEARNRQSMEYVHGTEDLLDVNGNRQIDSTSNQTATDPQLRTLGDNPGRDALSGLVNIARQLGAIPGHKSLVWIASDNVLADWTNGSLNIDKGDRVIQASVLRAQEAMNDAHVSVYPLDTSRLEAGGIDASIAERNVMLNPTATANQIGGAPGSGTSGCGLVSAPGPSHTTSSELTNGGDIDTCGSDMRPGRVTAQMQQDLHSIQGVYRELADATGGRTFRRASDMVSEFKSVVDDGRATYLLSFTPSSIADDKYHLISVRLAGRKDVKLRYRTGFFYRQEPTTFKDRFRKAVLEPEDMTEIALTADLLPASNGHTVKLGIGAADLAIAQTDALWTDKLDVFLVQREVTGTKASVIGQTMGLRLKPATYQQYLREGVPFNQIVELAPGVGSVRLVVVDENSGRMGSITIPASRFAAKP